MIRVAAALLLSLLTFAARGAELVGTSSDGHTWWIAAVDDGSTACNLLHSARSGPGFVRSQRRLTRPPQALASWGDRVWIVFPQQDGSREVFSLSVVADPALGGYFTVPRDHLGIEPPLESSGRLQGLVGTPGGPVALLLPHAGPGADPEAEAELRQLRSGSWQPIELPRGFDPDADCHLAPPRLDGGGLMLLCPEVDRGRTVAFTRSQSGTWERREIDAVLRSASFTRVGAQLVAIQRTGRAPTDERAVAYVRPTALAPITTFPPPEDPWLAAGMADGLRIISQSPQALGPRRFDPELVTVREVDLRSGAIGPARPMEPPSAGAGQVWQLSLLLAITVTAALMALVLRPAAKTTVNLPEGMNVLSPLSRAAALLLDMLPGAILAVIFLGATPDELVRGPLLLFRAELQNAQAYLLVVLVTGVHVTVTEMLGARSLGKLAVGAQVVDLEGARPRVHQALVRNLMKMAELVLPPLVLLALVSPYLQGVHDLLARTIVVERPRDADGPAGDEADEDR